jgi:hypothetical protein
MGSAAENGTSGDLLDELLQMEVTPVEIHSQCFGASAACSLVYLSACRTTGCDVMCITSTSRRFTEGQAQRKAPRIKGLAATIQYPSESSKLLGARNATKLRTPADELTDDAVRQRRNRELHAERDAYFKQIREQEEAKLRLQQASVTTIQRVWRGCVVRLKRRAESTGALPRHQTSRRGMGDGGVACLIVRRIAITKAEIGEELRALAHELGLKPIPSLTLAMNQKKSKRQRQQEQACALKIQATWRMYLGKRVRWQLLQQRHEVRRIRAAMVVIQAWKRYRKRIQDPDRENTAEAARNKERYKVFAQKFHSKAAVRLAEHQRLAAEAQERMNQALRLRPPSTS